MRRLPLSAFLALGLLTACASSSQVRAVQAYRDAKHRHDTDAVKRHLAPGARLWFEERTGEGEPLNGSPGSWTHWDTFFHTSSTVTGWKVNGNQVTGTVQEINDFYRYLDWKPLPYSTTWWLDGQGRITGVLIQSAPGKAASRMPEFKEWARAHHPDELDYLLPGGNINPRDDRPERWEKILKEWRAAAGLPLVEVSK